MSRVPDARSGRHFEKGRNTIRAVFVLVQWIVLLCIVILVGIVTGIVASILPDLPSTDGLDSWVPNQATHIYSSDGRLLAQLYVENREFVPITEVPQYAQHATVAIEDARFYSHMGADPKAILRALVNNLRNRDPFGQGGSTITEQLTKNLYLEQKKTLLRRVQQMLLALKIERRYSKEEILEMYLNEVCYGNGAFGIQAAAKLYFNKPAKELSLAEAALLAGLPRRPVYYSPFDNPEAAKKRQELVLAKMVEEGYISREQAQEAAREKLRLSENRSQTSRRFLKPYYVHHAIRELVTRYGTDMVYKGGLKVYTTLALRVQDAAEQAVFAGLRQVGNRNVNQAALVCIDPRDGRILALVGGRDFYRSQWNRATQARRQPGSSFKPYVYAAAIDNGYTPDSVIRDSQVAYAGVGGRPWSPRNYDGRYRGSVTLRTALALSINVVAVKLMEEVGVGKVIETARRMGITSPLAPYLPLALGASGVTLLEHTSAIGAFATGGLRAEPTTILKVLDHSGKPIDVLVPRVQRVLTPATAEAVRSMMITAVEKGTGRNADIPGYQVAGKTGTTSGGKDAWFIGFTPELVCGIWMGNDHNERMYRASGGFFCAPVWRNFMTRAIRILKCEKRHFDETSDITLVRVHERDPMQRVTLCAESRLLATPDCPEVVTEQMRRSKVPPRRCNLHGSSAGETEEAVTVCSESGQLATENCPSTTVRPFRKGTGPTTRCPMHTQPEGTSPSGGGDHYAPAERSPALRPGSERASPPPLPLPAVPDETLTP